MRTRGRIVVQGRRAGRGEWAARLLWGAAEGAVTLGVVVLLLVAHQLWWTNQQARADSREQVESLERAWGTGRGAPSDEATAAPRPEATPDEQRSGTGAEAPAPGEDDGPAYAVLRIPGLGVSAPVAEGVSKAGVLDKGYVGHYPQTGEPGAPGNFAVAGHRNTHGEPFRYLNRLRTGDEIRVETADARYVYAVARTIAQTTPGDGTVLEPVPYSSVHPRQRMSGPGHYLTLTTCTPEYTSTYRLVVWGELRRAEPR
ncbi:class E sortase [Streptomyces sp. HNM0574]|uniref:class E sortase n=1 Tax=Streptomyces sp. HNM0574 TaxID=2714954 RepID=UPI00146BB469|nr:class E sortase [Streptomyces sp. HNM0574]NLU66521.1 class E sortase [Streptomyces sp. HNM0574]